MPKGRKHGRTLPMLWVLLGAVIVLPLAALGTGGLVIWHNVVAEVGRDLQRRTDIGMENAARVFETHTLVLRTADQLTRGLTDAEIGARAHELHAQLAALVADLPQIRDVFVWGADGRALVSARFDPARSHDAAEQDDFAALRAGAPEPYVSAVLPERPDGTRVFDVARRRTGPSPGFAGVIAVSLDPAYFAQRWLDTGLADRAGGTSMALLRADGAIIARAPDPGVRPGRTSALFQAAVAHGAEWGNYQGRSVVDGVERRFFFRRVPGLDLFVIGSIADSAVRVAFVAAITPHLWFGIPAAVLLVLLVLLAIRRTMETDAALVRADSEQAARAQSERVLAHAAKLESIGHLAAGIAHDFNNILAATIGGLELAQRRLRAGRFEEAGPLLDHAMQAARRGADLTRQILGFARGADGAAETLDPAEVVTQVAALLPPLIGPAIRVEQSLDPGLWPVTAPRPALEAALMNLAVNARDAMPDGGTIRIRAGNLPAGRAVPPELEAGRDWVRIAFSDTGPGFPDEIRARAFEPFVTTKGVGRGTGLGLYQVYSGARQSGGTARIEDTASGGATIAIYLPRATPVPPAAAPTPSAAAPAI